MDISRRGFLKVGGILTGVVATSPSKAVKLFDSVVTQPIKKIKKISSGLWTRSRFNNEYLPGLYALSINEYETKFSKSQWDELKRVGFFKKNK